MKPFTTSKTTYEIDKNSDFFPFIQKSTRLIFTNPFRAQFCLRLPPQSSRSPSLLAKSAIHFTAGTQQATKFKNPFATQTTIPSLIHPQRRQLASSCQSRHSMTPQYKLQQRALTSRALVNPKTTVTETPARIARAFHAMVFATYTTNSTSSIY